ncbi:MAG: toxin-antitoxin system HicB family antitoxin, partial [Eubacterium sp.]|nr:toxin-antitoxin system HicB family antitoxin [Eubacterium sp.]
LLSYKNYYGTVEYSVTDDCLFGKVVGVRSLISYEGNSLKELKTDFQNAIDDYLDYCREESITPEVSISLKNE